MRVRMEASLDRYVAQVRRRGRELMAIARDEFPDLTILALFGHSLVLRDPEYDLYPAFLDGMLEGSAPGARIVDAYELAYGFRTRAEFTAARADIVDRAVALSAIPDLYRRHVAAGFGLWLDHGGPRRWQPADVARNYFTPDAFREALGHALAASDGYVWIYSQAPRFFPPRDLPPAYLEAIVAARRAAAP